MSCVRDAEECLIPGAFVPREGCDSSQCCTEPTPSGYYVYCQEEGKSYYLDGNCTASPKYIYFAGKYQCAVDEQCPIFPVGCAEELHSVVYGGK